MNKMMKDNKKSLFILVLLYLCKMDYNIKRLSYKFEIYKDN